MNEFKRWLKGLANALVSGAASGSAAGYLGVGWKKALAIAGASAGVSIAKYLAQHPPFEELNGAGPNPQGSAAK